MIWREADNDRWKKLSEARGPAGIANIEAGRNKQTLLDLAPASADAAIGRDPSPHHIGRERCQRIASPHARPVFVRDIAQRRFVFQGDVVQFTLHIDHGGSRAHPCSDAQTDNQSGCETHIQSLQNSLPLPALPERQRPISSAEIPSERKENRRCKQRHDSVLDVNTRRARIESREEARQGIGGYQEISDPGEQQCHTQYHGAGFHASIAGSAPMPDRHSECVGFLSDRAGRPLHCFGYFLDRSFSPGMFLQLSLVLLGPGLTSSPLCCLGHGDSLPNRQPRLPQTQTRIQRAKEFLGKHYSAGKLHFLRIFALYKKLLRTTIGAVEH